MGVSEEILKKYGAVSQEVAKEMLKNLQTDIGISVTGIAGPNGGTEEKPVGLVYIGIKLNDKIEVTKKIFKGERNRIRQRTMMYSLYLLFKNLKNMK